MLRVLKNIINQSLLKFGFRISKVNNTDELVKIYQYKNYDEYNEAMPKQGFKSGEQLNTELKEEHLARTKGKTLLTTGITY